MSSKLVYIAAIFGQWALLLLGRIAGRQVQHLVADLNRYLRVRLEVRGTIGLLAAPALEAISTMRLPSRQHSSGLTRGSPSLRPVVVSSATGALKECAAESARRSSGRSMSVPVTST